ncbi:MAG: GtrA family protein [Candidatus Zambryskibacteria bacterium]|nr:GtrA family protein [Candidatus Zambryskibacteria bacterium]
MRKFYKFSLYLYNHRVVRFLFSGGLAAAANIIPLFVLVHFFYIWYLLAAVVAFITAVAVSFMMQKFFTFNDYTREKIKQQTVLYLGIQIFNLCLNTLLMYVGVDLLHIHYILAQVLISGMMAVYNFFVYKHLVFTPDAVYTDHNQ